MCIIPARGGSKRILRKNIKNFLGKPIIAYSIEAAIKSNLFEKVMVSTDDKEIAAIARKYGAEVPFLRSEKNSNDFATTVDVLVEVIEKYQQNEQNFDSLCCIYPTAPFVTPKRLKDSYNELRNGDYDSVFPIIPFSYPIQRSLKIKDSRLQFFFPEYENFRSQDLETSYHDAGQYYFAKISLLLKNRTIISNYSSGIILSELEAQDIDNEVDWKLAEMKFRLMNEK